MVAINLSKCMVVVMVALLALGSHSTVEAVRRDEIKGLLAGATIAETSPGAKMDPCTQCAVQCTKGCKDCIADLNIF